jgi:hypothetical protein
VKLSASASMVLEVRSGVGRRNRLEKWVFRMLTLKKEMENADRKYLRFIYNRSKEKYYSGRKVHHSPCRRKNHPRLSLAQWAAILCPNMEI